MTAVATGQYSGPDRRLQSREPKLGAPAFTQVAGRVTMNLGIVRRLVHELPETAGGPPSDREAS